MCRGLGLVFLILVALACPSRADTSAPARIRPSAHHAVARYQRSVDGVDFIFKAVTVPDGERQLIEVEIEARSGDGAEHFMAYDPVEISGFEHCHLGHGKGSGSGWGSGGQFGSDGWDVGTRVAPDETARWSRRVPHEFAVARGCTLEVSIQLSSFQFRDAKSDRLDLAGVRLRVAHDGKLSLDFGFPAAK
jgi:hypothetical protein